MPGLNLTAQEAAARAALVSDAQYDITLDFTLDGDVFGSVTTLSFDAVPGSGTFLDAVPASVTRVALNGVDLAVEEVVRAGRIVLDGLEETNHVEVEATFAYRTDGQGIHRFVDPETGETYLYSQFAANDARSAFACFDQPDIKGTFAITVDAPASWVVVSNSPEPAPAARADGSRRWVFAPTPPLPCYVAAVIAGPYASAGGTLTSRKGELPARVYGRAQLAQHLDAQAILATTQAGLELYERMFDTEYPYDKYDQIFVPEYNLGAMENVGAVTISEDRLLFRSRPSEALRETRLNVVLHELAHMWFGNLVTMRWWDDLWLNESFAEYVGTWATEQVTEFSDAWVTFGASRKSIAYVQDQLPTTHAIVTEVPDTEATVSAFDMITYAKGASALKQLAAYVGEEAFFAGVAAYLKRYRHGNATLAEFLAELEAASGRSLTAWAHAWLETPGVTTLRAELEVDDAGVITALAVAEDVPEDFPVPHPHSLAVTGYAVTEGSFAPAWTVHTRLEDARVEIPEAVGLAQPDLLLVNDADLTYAKLRLDARSLDTVARHVGALTEAKPQAIVLDALWHMCRDGLLPAQSYIDAVLDVLPVMANSTAAESHARSLVTALTRYVAPDLLASVAEPAAERLWATLEAAAAGSDLQLQLVKAYAQVARTASQGDRLNGLLDGSLSLDGLTVDTDLGWELLAGAAAAGRAGEPEVAARLATDDTAAGRRRAAGVRASIGTIEAKRAAWDALAHPEGSTLTNATQYEVGLGLARVTDPELLAPVGGLILEELLPYYLANEGFVGARVAKYVFPVGLAGRLDGLEDAVATWLVEHAQAPSVLRKVVLEGLDEIRRALAAQAVSRAAA